MADRFRRTYVLRLWRDHADSPLHITVIAAAQPDERHHFATLQACLVFLHGHADAEESIAVGRVVERNESIVPPLTRTGK